MKTQQEDGLVADLRRIVAGEARFDDGSRALYATDASNYRQVPIGVVIPRSGEDIVATMAVCRRHGAPVLMRGGGTSLAGQCCNVAVVIDCSKYFNRILSIDPEKRLAVVEPGCILDSLRDAAEKYHLTFGPDPATHDHNTLGGMIGNNSCGVHSIMAGRTADNVEALDIVTYDGLRLTVGATGEAELDAIIAAGGRRGEIYGAMRELRDRYADLIRARYPKIPRRVSGYNLDELLPENGFHVARALVGSESTLVGVLAAHLRLVHSPPCRALLVLGYPGIAEAGDAAVTVRSHGPIGLEAIDDLLIEFMRRKGLHAQDLGLLPDGKGWLMAEFGGDTPDEATQAARDAQAVLAKGLPGSRVVTDPADQKRLWLIREAGLAATANIPGEPLTWPGWEDAAVPPERLGEYLRDYRALLDRYGYRCSIYGHFGDACVHCRIDFDLFTREGISHWRAFLDDAADLVVRYGGSLSGEHGDGQSRAELLGKMFGPELLQAFREFKTIWDPQWARQGSGPQSHHLGFAPRCRLPAPAPRHSNGLRAGRRGFPASGVALRRRGRVPAPRRRGHVSQFQGHPRGKTLDPGPRPPALRDDPWRCHHRRLAQRCCPRRAGPLLVLQRMQERLSCECRYGVVQGGVSPSLLPGAVAPAIRLFLGPHPLVGTDGRPHPWAGKRSFEPARAVAAAEMGRRHRTAAPASSLQKALHKRAKPAPERSRTPTGAALS